MRRSLVSLAVTALALGSCSAIKENVTVDVEGIIASSCSQLADKFSEQLADALVELNANTDAELPDIDVGALIDRAGSLGCSPDDMKQLVAAKLEQADATSDKAKALIATVSGELDSVSG